jgi:hypothetical protein
MVPSSSFHHQHVKVQPQPQSVVVIPSSPQDGSVIGGRANALKPVATSSAVVTTDRLLYSRRVIYIASLLYTTTSAIIIPAIQLTLPLDRRRQWLQLSIFVIGSGAPTAPACLEIMLLWLSAMPRASFGLRWQFYLLDHQYIIRRIFYVYTVIDLIAIMCCNLNELDDMDAATPIYALWLLNAVTLLIFVPICLRHLSSHINTAIGYARGADRALLEVALKRIRMGALMWCICFPAAVILFCLCVSDWFKWHQHIWFSL